MDNQILDSNLGDNKTNLLSYELAGTGKRFANYIIDAVIYYILVIVLGAAITIGTGSELGTLEAYVVTFGVMFFYYFGMEAAFGKSIGKFITGTRVLNDDFSKPSAGTIAKRTLCRFIPFEPFSFFGDAGWHDSITDTVVVND
jgi:uncharacterized RDD family membrane protein YckC